jgi:hypothetical protein
MPRRQKLGLAAAALATFIGLVSATSVIGREARLVDVVLLFFSGFGGGASLVATLSLHLSPTIYCGGGYGPVCCVTLGRPASAYLASTPPLALVASLADTAICTASSRRSVRDAGSPAAAVKDGRVGWHGMRHAAPRRCTAS